MSALSKLQQLKISTKLSSVVGGALIALCVMGGIAIFATGKIQSLGMISIRKTARFSAWR